MSKRGLGREEVNYVAKYAMKIKKTARVIYSNNPLMEVTCQVSFAHLYKIQEDNAREFSKGVISQLYPQQASRQQASLHISMGGAEQSNDDSSRSMRTILPSVFDFSSSDSCWKISVCADFIALTCTHYEKWEYFRERLMVVLTEFLKAYGLPPISKVGLRYKDVIERESIGLSGVPWSELLAGFIAGSLGARDLAEENEFSEVSILQQNFQALINFDGGKVLLQAGLLHAVENPNQQAFLIDSDFLEDFGSVETDELDIESLSNIFDRLHGNAGALFRLCIKEKLHDALGPRSE